MKNQTGIGGLFLLKDVQRVVVPAGYDLVSGATTLTPIGIIRSIDGEGRPKARAVIIESEVIEVDGFTDATHPTAVHCFQAKGAKRYIPKRLSMLVVFGQQDFRLIVSVNHFKEYADQEVAKLLVKYKHGLATK